MKRYELEMIPAREGEWVSFEDAAKKIHRLNNDLTSVTLERDALKRTMRLIEVQDQGCGGNLRAEEVCRAMQKLAREASS